jgi:hypothetical protein
MAHGGGSSVRRLLPCVMVLFMMSACAKPVPGRIEWVSQLAARPGSTLPSGDPSESFDVLLFGVTAHRVVGEQYFIAGQGLVTYNKGGTTLSGPNRGLDPFIELTIADRNDPRLSDCRALLAPESFVANSVRITGTGYFAPLPGYGERRLIISRIESIESCATRPRR